MITVVYGFQAEFYGAILELLKLLHERWIVVGSISHEMQGTLGATLIDQARDNLMETLVYQRFSTNERKPYQLWCLIYGIHEFLPAMIIAGPVVPYIEIVGQDVPGMISAADFAAEDRRAHLASQIALVT